MTNKAWLLSLAVVQGICAQSLITTYAGNGAAGFSGDGGPAAQASFNAVVGLATDPAGNLYMADQNNNRVRKVAPDGTISTFAGNGAASFSGDGGPAAQAGLNYVTGVCVAPSGDIYINDLGNHRMRKVAAGTGIISTVAGNGSATPSGDGGQATAAGMQLPIRCAVDAAGNLYIVDQGNAANVVRKVDASTGIITRYAGVYGGTGASGDGGPATSATMFNLTAASFDAAGNLYLTDQGDQRIRKVDTSGIITTVAGSGTMGFSGDGGPAIGAQLNQPGETAVDSAGSLFFLDVNNQRVRKVSGGVISTVAGTGTAGFAGDNGPPAQAQINGAFALALDSAGNLYIGDLLNNRIRKVTGVAAAGAAPAIGSTSAGPAVANAASFQTGIAPGGIVTIFGSKLGAAPGQIVTAGVPWTTSLSGIGVTMDGTAVPVYRVLNLNGQEQLSVLAPFSLTGKNSTSLVVSTPAGSSPAVSVPVYGAQPGIFILDSASSGAVHANGTVVNAAAPAAPGETVVLYLTGLGPVSNGPAAGQPASLTTLSQTTLSPTVTIGGFNATVAFAGLTPGYIGLYQINVAVPGALPSGTTADVTVSANGITSNTAKLPVH